MSAINQHLTQLEESVDKGEHSNSYVNLVALLKAIEANQRTSLPDSASDSFEAANRNANRFASVIERLFLNQTFVLDYEAYVILIAFKQHFLALFSISDYASTKNILQQLLKNSSSQEPKVSKLFKWFILVSLEQIDDEAMKVLKSIDPQIATPAILSLVALPVVMNNTSHQARERMLDLGDVVASCEKLHGRLYSLFAAAWMYCSYAERADKHLFKGHLNLLMQKMKDISKIPSPKINAISRAKKRPTMLILAEVFDTRHAMYRCFAGYIEQLGETFDTVLVTSDSVIDGDAKKLFHRVITFPLDSTSIWKIVNLIVKEKPDIVFYPSLGMAYWTLAILPFRFAPIQIMTGGHPATSVSDSIDYLMCVEFLAAEPALYSEKILTFEDDVEFFCAPTDEHLPEPQVRDKPDTIRIAVPSKSFKLSAPFLAACQHIDRLVERSIEWVIFPDEIGFQHHYCPREIQKWLPSATVLPRMPYNEYLNELNQCDISVGTFPFGGSNTNIDLIRLGIPKSYYTGAEMHSRTDASIFNYFDYPDWLSCKDIKSWCEATLQLINDDGFRVSLSHSLISQSRQKLTGKSKCREEYGFSDSLKWAWENHKEILNSDARVIVPHRNEQDPSLANDTKEYLSR